MHASLDDVLAARRTRAAHIRGALEAHGYEFQQGSELGTGQFVPVLAPSASVRDAVLVRAREAEVDQLGTRGARERDEHRSVRVADLTGCERTAVDRHELVAGRGDRHGGTRAGRQGGHAGGRQHPEVVSPQRPAGSSSTA